MSGGTLMVWLRVSSASIGVLAALPSGLSFGLWLPRMQALDPEIRRQAVLWGLPLAAMLLSFVLQSLFSCFQPVPH